MLKLGILIQQRGEWKGRRVVSASWIDAAIARQSRVDDSDYGLGIWHRWYGVQIQAGQHRVDTIMLSGNGGQKVFLVPSLDLIVVFTGGAFNLESPVNEMMAQVLLPVLLDTRPPDQRRSNDRWGRGPQSVGALQAVAKSRSQPTKGLLASVVDALKCRGTDRSDASPAIINKVYWRLSPDGIQSEITERPSESRACT
jgi:CubicO group peptidase (beta-lactamase class C family)